MHLDLAVWLNLISTAAIVAALIFAALQVRQGNIKRKDQAAIALIETIQDEGWARAIDLIGRLPGNANLAEIQASGSEVERALTEFGVRLETIGYLAFRRSIDLEMVDDLVGRLTLMYWSRAKNWCERQRELTDNPKYAEWCEWLANRITERREKLGHKSASVHYSDWRE
jgi:hypothetical protein